MQENNEIRKGRHCVFDMHVHLVSSPNTGTGVRETASEAPRTDIRRVCENFRLRLEEFNGETDHVHLLVSFPPHRRTQQARQQPQRGVQPIPEYRDYPRTRTALLAGQTTLVGKLLRGNIRRCTTINPEKVHPKPEQTTITSRRKALHPRPKGRSPRAKKEMAACIAANDTKP